MINVKRLTVISLCAASTCVGNAMPQTQETAIGTQQQDSTQTLPAQWNLQACIDYALQQNITIRILFLDRRGKAMVSYQWEKRFQRAVEKHNKENKRKLPKITPHICRHTYCTNMAKSGISPKTLQYLMGHSSIEVTMNVYTHLGLADAKREVDRLEAMKEINEKEQAGKRFRMA